MAPDSTNHDRPAARRARLVVAYHGAHFRGMAANGGVRTVAGDLGAAIALVARCEVTLSVAGRTDAGVHARAQVVSCDLPAATDLGNLAARVNSMCRPSIAVRSAEWAEPGFDARASATWRHYRYLVCNTPAPDPMLADRSWHVRPPLSLALMNLACDAVMGEQDFTSFCRRPETLPDRAPAGMKRRVTLARWGDAGDGTLVFDIRANAFCQQMVRSLTGFLVDVGLGRRPPSDLRGAILARDRSASPRLAPPEGLTLWEVGYDGERVHP